MTAKIMNQIKFVLFMTLTLILTISGFASAASADTNLIANPGFESGSIKPLNWTFASSSGNVPIWDTVSHSGTRSIKISIPGTTRINSGYPLSDSIKVEPLKDYTLSAWVKSEGVVGGPTVRVVQYDANWISLSQLNLEFNIGTNDWTQKQLDFKTLSNTAIIMVYANIWSSYGTFWLDDVAVSPKSTTSTPFTQSPTPTPIPTSTNLIINSGFESGSIKPLNWTFASSSGNVPIWDTVSHSGTRSIKISIPGTTMINSGYPFSDYIKVEPLKDYTLSAWVKSEGVVGGPTVRVVQYDASMKSLSQLNLEFNSSTNDWTQKQLDFKTLSNTAYIMVYANIWSGYGTFWLDEVGLTLKSATSPSTPIPTPTPTSDTSPPSIIINSPSNGQTFTTSTITVNGAASDNKGLSKVEVKVGSGTLITASGTTSWSRSLTLASGSNTVYARATDTSGNIKDTSVIVTYNPPVIGSGGAISINPDKTLNVNGKKTFPVYMSNICNAHFEYNTGVEPCNPTKNSEFLFSGDGDSIAGISIQKSAYEATNVMYTMAAAQINSIPQDYIDSPNFFGYTQINEPSDSQESIASSRYNAVKARDTKHPVLMDHWLNMPKWIKYGDIITMWIYPFRPTNEWAREDSLYAYEQMAGTAFFTDKSTGKFTEINTVSKPVYGGIQANILPDQAGIGAITPKEVRALTYTTITMDVKGIGFWGYLNYGGSLNSTSRYPYGTPGLYNDPQLHSYYRQLGRELVSFNDILVLPTKDYSWHFRNGTQVSFNPNPTKTVLWKTRPSLNYLLKQDGNTWYLFVVNKDTNPIANMKISIQGLTGSMTVKTLGLETSGSGRAGRVFAANNGQFTDSFDGYAVHIYKLS